MYQAIKSDAISEVEARKIAGDKVVNDVLKINCEFTNRVIDDVFEVEEMSASLDFTDKNGDDQTITVLYLIDKGALADCDDLCNLSYDNYTFIID